MEMEVGWNLNYTPLLVPDIQQTELPQIESEYSQLNLQQRINISIMTLYNTNVLNIWAVQNASKLLYMFA